MLKLEDKKFYFMKRFDNFDFFFCLHFLELGNLLKQTLFCKQFLFQHFRKQKFCLKIPNQL